MVNTTAYLKSMPKHLSLLFSDFKLKAVTYYSIMLWWIAKRYTLFDPVLIKFSVQCSRCNTEPPGSEQFISV